MPLSFVVFKGFSSVSVGQFSWKTDWLAEGGKIVEAMNLEGAL